MGARISKDSSSNKATKLFSALMAQAWQDVLVRLKLAPNEASTWLVIEFGNGQQIQLLPLHAALTLSPPKDVIEELILAWPKALTSKESLYHRLPLHLACTEGAGSDIVVLLLQKNPSTAKIKDKDQMLPLHLACLAGAKVGVIEALVQSYPLSVYEKDCRGNNALKLAQMSHSAYKQAVITTIAAVTNANPNFSGRRKPNDISSSDNKVKGGDDDVEEVADSSGNLHDMKEAPVHEYSLLTKLIMQKEWEGVIEVCNSSQGCKQALRRIVSEVEIDPSGDDESGFIELITWERLPLHEACRRNPPKYAIQALCTASAANLDTGSIAGVDCKESMFGRLPIHIAVSESANKNVISVLLEVSPRSAHVFDKDGNLPVHLAYLNGASEEIIGMLLNAYPESVFVSNFAGRTPFSLLKKVSRPNKAAIDRKMHTAVSIIQQPVGSKEREIHTKELVTDKAKADSYRNQHNFSNLINSITKRQWSECLVHTSTMTESDAKWIESEISDSHESYGRPFLHEAIRLGAPDDIISALVNIDRENVRIADTPYGRLPIHVACEEGSSFKTIEMLLQEFPQAAMRSYGPKNYLPIHLACINGTSEDTIKLLIDYYRTGAAMSDKDGNLPIHYAIWNKAPEGILKCLLEAYPKCSSVKDSNGWIPLHYACCRNLSEDFILKLIDLFPSGAGSRNSDGWLPLHFAAENANSELVIHGLLRSYPQGLKAMNDGGFTPLSLAKKLPKRSRCKQMLVGNLEMSPQEWGAPPEDEQKPSPKPIYAPAEQCDSSVTAIADKMEVVPNTERKVQPIWERKMNQDPVDDYIYRNSSSVFDFSTPSIGILGSSNPPKSQMSAKDAEVSTALGEVSMKDINIQDGEDIIEYESDSEASDSDFFEDSEEEEGGVDSDDDDWKDTVLWTVMSRLVEQKQWNGLESRCKVNPQECSQWTVRNADRGEVWRRLPLHEAVTLEPPKEAVSCLIDAYAMGVSSPDNFGQFPLHLACKAGTSIDIIELLVSADPTIVLKKNKKGETPLDIAKSTYSPHRGKVIELLSDKSTNYC